MKKNKKYYRAIILIQNQVQLFWLVFSAFLITETVILSAIVTLIKDEKNILIFFVSIFGLIICLAWWSSFQYNHSFYQLRIEEAKKLEEINGFYRQGEELIKKRWILIGEKLITIPWHGGSPVMPLSPGYLIFWIVSRSDFHWSGFVIPIYRK